ncbi:unnamed protein product [Somion occarium]|uniref:Uncharacterized protein n=1 Tax=Somion occarium TaxID=3059160 RepID=A0ABP1DVL8_9APHY
MSRKYMARAIRTKAYGFLQLQFPSQYELFLERYEGGVYTSLSLDSLVRAANAAREANALIILPSILFLLCTRTMDDVLKYAFPSGGAIVLSPPNLIAILKGRSRISLFARKHIYSFAFLNKEVLGCQASYDCRSLNGLWAETAEQAEGWIDPFERLPEQRGLRLIRNARCAICRTKAGEEMVEGRDKIWHVMPGMFDLPDWKELSHISQSPEDLLE